jgi:hypothetical protein
MCYYSTLENIEARAAVLNDELVIKQDPNVVMFVAARDPDTAVCLCEGLELVLSGLPQEITRKHSVGVVAIATFFTHKTRRGEELDCLYFGLDRRNALYLKDLPAGVSAFVRSIPKSKDETPELQNAA